MVRKGTGVPGDGFLEAMILVGYIKRADKDDERAVWDRALRETHEYWCPKLRDDLK